MTTGTEASEGFFKVEEPKQKSGLCSKNVKGSKFMLFVEGKEMPSHKHASFNSAFREAVRISELEPDRRILVVKHLAILEPRKS